MKRNEKKQTDHRFLKHIVFICLIILSCSGITQAKTKLTGQSIMKFLNIGIGAKAAGMGDSFINCASDASIFFWNPAGISILEGNHVFFDQNSWIADINQYSFAYTKSLNRFGSLGFGFTYLDYGKIYGTTIDLVAASAGSFEYIETGLLNVKNYSIGLAYARSISSSFSVGGLIKYVYSGLDKNTLITEDGNRILENNLGAFAIDFGTRFNTGYKDLTFSMALRNFSRETHYPEMIQGFYLPLIFSLGFSVDAFGFLPFIPEDHVFTVAFTGLHPMDFLEKVNLGFEYSFKNSLYVRGGYKINYSLEDMSLGFGYVKKLSDNRSLGFDYSFSNMKFFNAVNRYSLVFSF